MCCFKLQPGEFLQVDMVFVHTAQKLLHPLHDEQEILTPQKLAEALARIWQNHDFINHYG